MLLYRFFLIMKKSSKLPVNFKDIPRSQHIKELTKKQDSLRAICDSQFNYKRKRVLDHCHLTGQIRGLLCYNCNLGLGMFKDDCAVLYRAIVYLSKFKPSQEEWEASERLNTLPDVWDARTWYAETVTYRDNS